MFVFTRKQLVKLLNGGKATFIIDSIINKFKRLQESHDFVVVEGTDFTSITNEEFDINISIAENLGIPVAIIVLADGKPIQEIVDTAVSTVKSFSDKGVQVLTFIANRVEEAKGIAGHYRN